ncbi:rhamnulokinase [Actinokineospora iranica]|uniref:Rhamnulokinase n=1 Tax=Actinokineospora iranica TaxID=1271860 RepID=A0A1G6J0A7_9PSEU|nr:rhamnulokinase family protein [Actinokineospora iranica]SDC12214.1 rhamnulokinase [Actinokineospora iranica]
MSTAVAAVDLGASSGRVMVGRVEPDRLTLAEVTRFRNGAIRVHDTLHWDVLRLYRGVLDGLRAAGPGMASVGIDSWAVDYGLLDETGALIGNPVSHRDDRTREIAPRLRDAIGADTLYETTGLQYLPFNTLYQLAAEPRLARASTLLLIPDLLTYWLTGDLGTEYTNASTTQLLDIHTGQFSPTLLAHVSARPSLFPPLRQPGSGRGDLLPHVLAATGLSDRLPVTAVASHDTASAVVGVPAAGERFGYVSCGTWSLVGIELTAPVLSAESRAANFANEGGVDGTVRYLRNVMGLWLLQECRRVWAGVPLDALLAEAAAHAGFGAVVDPDDAVFLPPNEAGADMPTRIADYCARTGQPVPRTPGEITRCVVDSLAAAYRRALDDARRLSGRDIDVVHIVGGGSRNALLCQATADACGLPVVAGPVEAAALGNVLVQARGIGALPGDLPVLRDLVRRTQPLRRYRPRNASAVA